jgi:hypothetical protein
MRRFIIRTGTIATAVASAAALTALATGALAGPATATAATTAVRASAARASASDPACTASELGVWVPPNQGNGAAGTIYYPLEFTNLGSYACSMYGNPGVSAINGNGQQLGAPATWSGTRQTVTLAPGATAHATLAYHDAVVGSYPPADHAQAFELRVYPPGQTSTQEAYWDLTALTIPVPFLSVGPIQPGVGTIYTS